MTDPEHWLNEFGLLQQEMSNPLLYWLSAPALLIGTVGLLWSLPIPEEFARISHLLNFGSLFLMVSVVYYFIISMPLAVGMLPFILGIATIEVWLSDMPTSLGVIASVLIGAGTAGLCFGHYASGGIKAVRRDVQLIIIAPIWLLSNLYRRLGIPY